MAVCVVDVDAVVRLQPPVLRSRSRVLDVDTYLPALHLVARRSAGDCLPLLQLRESQDTGLGITASLGSQSSLRQRSLELDRASQSSSRSEMATSLPQEPLYKRRHAKPLHVLITTPPKAAPPVDRAPLHPSNTVPAETKPPTTPVLTRDRAQRPRKWTGCRKREQDPV
jgi:hypothetical protein